MVLRMKKNRTDNFDKFSLKKREVQSKNQSDKIRKKQKPNQGQWAKLRDKEKLIKQEAL